VVFALTQRAETPSKPLRLNFYEQPDSCIEILASMLQQDNKLSNYIRSFASVKLPAIEDIGGLPEADKARPIRKIQIYWAILHKAGFAADEGRLKGKGLTSMHVRRRFVPQLTRQCAAVRRPLSLVIWIHWSPNSQ